MSDDLIGVQPVAGIENLRVSADPAMHEGIACLMTLRAPDGRKTTIGLETAAFRELVHALVLHMPPSDLALGRN